MLKRLLNRKPVAQNILVPMHLGVLLPQQGLHLIVPEAFAEVPQCLVDDKPTSAAWNALRLVIRGSLFQDEVLACTVNNGEYHFVAGVAVIHLYMSELLRHDPSLLIPVNEAMDSCSPEVLLAIKCMQQQLDQFAEAQRF